MRKILLPLALTFLLLSVRTLEVQSKVITETYLANSNGLSNTSTSEKVQVAPEADSIKAAQAKPAGYRQQPLTKSNMEDLYPVITKRALDKIYEALQVIF